MGISMKTYTIDTFLQSPTPQSWLEVAVKNLPLLLVDHAHCEKKAASTAIGHIYRYSDKPELLVKMAKLAREELVHFEKVLAIIERRGEQYTPLTPGGYANRLHQFITNHEPNRLIDVLIVGAYIEARSCERFRLLASSERIPEELAKFYQRLYLAEERHFEMYLNLAVHYAKKDIEERILFFGKIEAAYINEEDNTFRFHSGVPTQDSNSINSEPSLIKSPIL